MLIFRTILAKGKKLLTEGSDSLKKFIFIVIFMIWAFGYVLEWGGPVPGASSWAKSTDVTGQITLDEGQSDTQVLGKGTVTKILRDDLDGSRHQKFILRLHSGQTVLIAHNIDLAPRIGDLSSGDTVEFYGEFEWNSKGGVIHWTHRDPGGRHIDGWLKHQGRTYQ